MGFIERESDRLAQAIIDGSDRREELYAAQQALSWALDPFAFKSPAVLILGVDEPGVGNSPLPETTPA